MSDAAPQHLASPPTSGNPSHITLSADERAELRQLRRRKGIMLKAIARKIGVSPQMLARYSCGERRPPRWVLDAWRKELS